MDNKINKNVRHENKKRKRTSKKFSWGLMVGFILFELVFTIVTAPFVLLYGPFENAKSRFVGTAMGSMNYQWLATTFLSDEKISEIIGDKQSDENNVENTDGSLINIPKVKDNNITYATLDKNNNFTGHVLIINNPTRVKVGYTSKLNSANPEGETTSQIAMNNGAVAAVNGGAFTDEADTAQWTANGGTPSGVIISEGKIVYDDTAGKELGTVGITAEGKLVAGRFSTEELKEMKVTEAVSYNTTVLVSKGKSVSLPGGDGGEGSSPRTLIGQRADGSIVLAVLDARVHGSRIAATLKEAQEVMSKLECVTAATLDGGKSATMYYNEEVVNTPSYAFGERSIPTAIIVK
ncbi:phosphodiester glycosidase family protein [uncultured Clostridium sp.]|uniref:phosphodiester glycosidase family protein n=1 Tax=uncultured Clostridium sp. TaxID=59620 RepID=UPI0025CE6511|nr:phosphodiester glycosidase family protein [uncultured Clostridium sp.]